MLKKLDILIIKSFIGPFIATFFITLLVLIMQFFWLWVDDFVGKGVSSDILMKFIWYQSAMLVPLALPLAVLLSSIMTFGNLGETYELVAIKSAGISLLRFMRPLLVLTAFICGIAFLFSNNIIPVAFLRSRTLLQDIVHAKPSFDLKEGVFYDKISGFSIKVGKKENDTTIRDVIIYEANNNFQDNFIVASDGVMRSGANKRFLEFHLRNGWRYEERGSSNGMGTDFIRMGFKEYKRQFDISSFGLQKINDSPSLVNARMYTMNQLERVMDSLQRVNSNVQQRTHQNVFGGVPFARYLDSVPQAASGKPKRASFDALIPDSLRSLVNQRVINRLSGMKVSADISLTDQKYQAKTLRQHQIEWHRKISYSVACLVLFLIGAPLGSIIRKGGIGSPLVFAIIFFMVFYFTNSTGEKMAKEGSMNVVNGMWLSTFVLLPIGAFLTYKALHDSQVFNKDFYARLFRVFRRK